MLRLATVDVTVELRRFGLYFLHVPERAYALASAFMASMSLTGLLVDFPSFAKPCGLSGLTAVAVSVVVDLTYSLIKGRAFTAPVASFSAS